MVKTCTFSLQTQGTCDLLDVTRMVREAVASSGIRHGTVTVFVPGSTAGITTLEYESGAVRDFQELMDQWIPADGVYHHNERWGDGNGFSHIRSAVTGPSLTVPIQEGKLLLGTWQQIVLACFDNRPRERTVVLQILGES
jgi:secondary thiamine-phosphate synthase enzyme